MPDRLFRVSSELTTLEISESDKPVLLGDKSLQITPSDYLDKAKSLDPGRKDLIRDRRRPFALRSQIAHLLVVDLLREAGWKVAPHRLGRGTSPFDLSDPVKFIESTQNQRLSDEIKSFLRGRHPGIPGAGLRCDLLVANEEDFVLLEIKSTTRDTYKFRFNSLGQLLFYLQADKLGIPVKLVCVRFLDSWRMVLARFPEREFLKGKLMSPGVGVVQDGTLLSLLILRHLIRKKRSNVTTIARELDQSEFHVEHWSGVLLSKGFVKSLRRRTYGITDEGAKELDESVKLLRNYAESLPPRVRSIQTILDILCPVDRYKTST